MSSPSKAVDVLDWIRIATTGLNCLCEGSPAAKRGIVVRDAVAELIAADREYDAAKARRIEADNRVLRDRSDDAFREKTLAHHAYDRAVDRRRAALSTIGESQ